MNVLFLQLLLLSSFLSNNAAKKSKWKSRKKNERASLLGLTEEYSTFELPFKYSPNLIKIGEATRNMNSIKLLIQYNPHFKTFRCQNCFKTNLRNFYIQNSQR